MKRNCIMVVLVCALAGPGNVHAAADDMFGMMFRMMLTMMNVMSDTMLDRDNGWGGSDWTDNFGLGGLNTFNAGLGGWPMASGLGSPFTSFGYSPFNTFGMSPWTAVSPWSGMSPWSLGSNPWSGMSPWSMGSNPWNGLAGSGWPGTGLAPFGNTGRGYPRNFGSIAPGNWYRGILPGTVSLLDGRWYGTSGEILEIRGNRFRLRQGKLTINGVITLENDIVTLFSPQTRTTTRYTFMRNQSGLLLQDASGKLLRFTNRPPNGVMRIF